MNNEPAKEKRYQTLFLRFPLQEQILFAKRLSLMVKAGVPILLALRMLHKQTKSKGAQAIFGHLAAGVEQGQNISSTLRTKYHRLVGEFMINVIEVGEVSGTLQENLHYLAEELQKKQILRRKVVNAMVYPVFIIIATIGITILLTAYVFPKVVPIFSSVQFELPLTTKILIFISSAFADYWYILLILVVALVGGFILSLRREKFKTFIGRSLLRIPIVGRLIQSYNMATMCRTLGVLLRSNVPITKALSITANASANLSYRNVLREIVEYVRGGGKLSEELLKYPQHFPPITAQMVGVGETTGSLSNSLIFLAELYENEVDDQTKNLSSILEPALMVFIGLLVGFVAISIITPIYQFTQNLHP